MEQTSQVKDLEGNITSDFKNFKLGSLKMDGNGKVETFQGSVGEYGSYFTINGDKYNLPAGAKFEYKLGTTSTDFGEEGGEFLYESKNAMGNIDPVNRISAKGKVNIKDGVISPGKSFDVFGPSGDIGVEPIGGRNAEIGIGVGGELTSIENAKVDFRDSGFVASSAEKTNIYYDGACEEDAGYLCMDNRIGKEKLVVGGSSPPIIEMSGSNKYFQGEEGDYVKLSKRSSDSVLGAYGTNEVIIEKDRLTVEGESGWEIINGEDKLTTYADGSIRSSKLIGSENTAMPMKVYTSQNGKLGEYYSEANNDGVIKVEASEVGYIEKGKYLIQRGGVYDSADMGAVTEKISKEVVESIPFRDAFGGHLEPGEKVVGYTLSNSKYSAGAGEDHRGLGTMSQSQLYIMCDDIGVECLPEKDNTGAVMALYDKSQQGLGEAFSVIFKTDKGNIYEFERPDPTSS